MRIEARARPAPLLPGAMLLHPLPAVAAALIAFNDFVLKVYAPGWISGKLSDVGLCFLLPVFLTAVGEWGGYLYTRLRRREPAAVSRAWVVAACGVSGLYFALLQLSAAFARGHEAALGALVPIWRFEVTQDPTDLVTLVMILAALRYLVPWARPPRAMGNGRGLV